MKNNVVNSYQNSTEELRFDIKSRKIEFINTTRIIDEHITKKSNILDCAAGTGVYAFYYADRGHNVTATDITPRHIEIIRENLITKDYKMKTAALDATDLSVFADNSFDVVFNMGPFYHLKDNEQREKCISECLRVLKPNGLIFTAYISRYFIFQFVGLANSNFIDKKLSQQILDTGIVNHEDEKCFWTDTYYTTIEEMESLYKDYNVEIVDHFAQDGITPYFKDKIEDFTEEQFDIWCDNHYRICREKSQLGASNHIIIVGKK